MNKKNTFIFLFIIAFLAGLVTGFWAERLVFKKTGRGEVRLSDGYRYINPLLECEIENDSLINQKYLPFEKITKKRIQDFMGEKYPKTMYSVYMRNLNNGPWFGINERALFSPASLLKLPILLAYIKIAEEDRSILKRKILFSEHVESVTQNIKPSSALETGKEYTVEDLLARMIIYSDNDSADILDKNLPAERLLKVYRDLGVEIPDVRSPDDFMSVKDYASFFRMLYNASYLNKESSEKVLALLTRSEFSRGIREGVPAEVEVAHKFGERIYKNEDSSIEAQLHDCGIVYHPKYPYLLCIMSRGNNFQDLARTVSQISKIIFKEIDSRFPLKK